MIGMSRREILIFLGLLLSPQVRAKEVSSDSIRTSEALQIILPFVFTSGGVRKIIEEIGQQSLGNYFIEAKPGASGLIATKYLLSQPITKPTIMVSTASTSALNFLLRPELSPNPLEVFQPLGIVCENNAALITSREGINSVEDLVSITRKMPGQLNISTPGIGSLYHVAYLMMSSLLGIQATHIPYSAGKHSFGIYNGDIDFGFVSIPEAVTWESAGKITILAVTSRKRAQELPHIRSLAEIHPKLIINDYIGLVARQGISNDFSKQVNSYLARALKSKDIEDVFLKYGYVAPKNSSIDYHRNKMITELNHWKSLLNQLPHIKS